MSTKNKWLIKSDYKILGPYSYEQVEDLIMKKQISLIDEIRDMDMRWSYVREVPDFKQLVESVRKSLDKKADLTQTLQTALQRTNTRASATDLEDTEPNQSPAYTGINFSQVEVTRAFPSEIPTPPVSEPIMVEPKKSRQVTERSLNYSSNKKSVHLLVKFIIVVVLLFSGIAGFQYYAVVMNQNKSEKLIFQQIRKYNLYGQDDKSIELFKKLPAASQEKVLVDLIPLWPKLEAAGVIQANQTLDLISKGKMVGNDRKVQYQLVKFNNAFNLGDTQNAEDALVKAIALDASSLEVKENDAILSLTKERFPEAAKAFKNLYDQSNLGRLLYGYIISLVLDPKQSLDANLIFHMIEKHVNARVDFNKELLFLQLYVIKKYLPENADLYNQYYNAFVQFPHRFSKYFKISSLVSGGIYNWEYLLKLKKNLPLDKENKRNQMVNIQFLLEKGEYDQAQDIYQKNAQIFNEIEKYNIEVALNYFKKSSNDVLRWTKSTASPYLSTQIYIMLMLIEDKNATADAAKQEIELQYVNLLMKEKPLFSNWAQLMMLKYPRDRDQIKALINKDTVYGNDFLPYLELKAALNE